MELAAGGLHLATHSAQTVEQRATLTALAPSPGKSTLYVIIVLAAQGCRLIRERRRQARLFFFFFFVNSGSCLALRDTPIRLGAVPQAMR
jgi:hypothetical protein